MTRSRLLATFLLVLGLIALAVPMVALANGGGSAGDQQYVDPLANQHKHSTTTSSPATTSTPAPPPSTTPATPAPTPTPTSSAATPSTTPTATTPTATIAGTSTVSSGKAKQLPYTGYDSGLAAGLGFVLVLGGTALRLKTRRTSAD
jgi:hypothetical protein